MVTKHPIRVWVLAVGKGDSVVIQLPDGDWAVIDSKFSLDSDYKPAAFGVLERMKPHERVRFICLTHYHKDHYEGLGQIFDEYSEKFDSSGMFFHSGFLFADQYKAMEWSGIEELLKLRKKHFSSDDPETYPIEEREIVHDNWDEIKITKGVSIRFVAPSSRQYGSIKKTLLDYARKGRDEPRPFNRIGISFILKYGKATLLFTDDIEKPAWRRIKSRFPNLRPCFFTVSHHGSKDNNPDWLWPWLANKSKGAQKQHAVISADGSRCHPADSVVTSLEKQFVVHKTYVDSNAGKRSSVLSTMRRTGRKRSARSSSPVETWRDTITPSGNDCYFEIHPTGRVVPKKPPA